MKKSRSNLPSLMFAFSLIELMIVLIIIAVLASIAIPGFQNQIARAHVTGGLTELRNLSTAYEDAALRGVASFDLADLGLETEGLSATTSRCELAMTLPDIETGNGALSCALIGHPNIQSSFIRLERQGHQGRWECISDLADQYRPSSCLQDGI